MEMILNSTEIRVLGCLMEKELATPEYYPLTLNALVNACNQRSNRQPVMTMDEAEVSTALDSLRMKQLALVSAEGGRVEKYRHTMLEKLRLDPGETALLAELLLRGPQTVAELRTRGERMHHFDDPADVESALEELMERTPPLVTRLPRSPGHKERRYSHLLADTVDSCADGDHHLLQPPAASVSEGMERIAVLEREMESLRSEVAELRRTVLEFKSQFE